MNLAQETSGKIKAVYDQGIAIEVSANPGWVVVGFEKFMTLHGFRLRPDDARQMAKDLVAAAEAAEKESGA